MGRGSWFSCVAWVLFVSSLAGCLQNAEPQSMAAAVGSFPTTFRVLDATSSEPVFLARVTVLGDEGPLLVINTDRNGTAPLLIPADAATFEVLAQGYAPFGAAFATKAPVVVVRLQPFSDPSKVFDGAGLSFRPAVDLGSRKYLFAVGTSCLTEDAGGDRDGDCGLGEPSVEVDGRGTVYVTGVCCIGNAPPVYVSRDDGATFKELATPTGIRERFGVEGDFAIDEKGTVYFADIEVAASFQLTAWDKDGAYLRHMKWPAQPVVDRDWIRAEGDGKLYYVYNTGGSTNVYTSEDGGMTWTPRPAYTAPYGLGGAVKGTKAGELWVIGNSGLVRRADFTRDGGATWNFELTKSPSGGGMPSGAFDEGGNLYLTGGRQDALYVTRRSVDGVWQEPVQFTPDIGHHRMPWVAAGGPGKVAIAWYGTLEERDDARWFLFVAASLDADQPDSHWQVAVADPEPVVVGDLGRQLLDFLQCEIGPDGAIHVAYSKLRADEPNAEEKLQYVHSNPTLPLASSLFLNGPAAS